MFQIVNCLRNVFKIFFKYIQQKFILSVVVCLQNGSLLVLKDFSGRGGNQSRNLEILGGTSPDTLTFYENIYLPADNFRGGTSEKKTPCIWYDCLESFLRQWWILLQNNVKSWNCPGYCSWNKGGAPGSEIWATQSGEVQCCCAACCRLQCTFALPSLANWNIISPTQRSPILHLRD